MPKETKDEKKSPTNLRVREDGREEERRGIWIPKDVAVEMRVYCLRNEIDEHTLITRLLVDFLNQEANRGGGKKLKS